MRKLLLTIATATMLTTASVATTPPKAETMLDYAYEFFAEVGATDTEIMEFEIALVNCADELLTLPQNADRDIPDLMEVCVYILLSNGY